MRGDSIHGRGDEERDREKDFRHINLDVHSKYDMTFCRRFIITTVACEKGYEMEYESICDHEVLW